MKLIEKMLLEEKELGFITKETIEIYFSGTVKLSVKDIVFGAQIIDRQRAGKSRVGI
jgi:hypothetical protein